MYQPPHNGVFDGELPAMGTNAALPGFASPAVGFEQPFAMLVACHERVNRTLGLLRRLLDHVDGNGHDKQSRSAAADVLRYFDVAAPLHHEDEEFHVFPVLVGGPDARLRDAISALQRDHECMATGWMALRSTLVQWRDDKRPPLPDAALRQRVDDFTGMYASHIHTEESLVYPAAQAFFDEAGLARIGAEMQSRRTAG